jgi:hypothetical protein
MKDGPEAVGTVSPAAPRSRCAPPCPRALYFPDTRNDDTSFPRF